MSLLQRDGIVFIKKEISASGTQITAQQVGPWQPELLTSVRRSSLSQELRTDVEEAHVGDHHGVHEVPILHEEASK